ncbi:MAG: branched-chain amino acid aminotransferase [Defluviitaleaceae bacterium]|nr:branched-chain amino acid aminotransferase [Defluviitaleaceae bacterium]
MEIKMELTKNPKTKPVFGKDPMPFGKIFTDHMFLVDYNHQDKWYNPRIVPHAPLILDPATVVLHYSQTIFEGMKAFKSPDDEVLLFRAYDNAKRFNVSAYRMHMPEIDEELFLEAVKTLVKIDKDWVPNLPGMSLYIRPFMIATEITVNLTYPENFMFCVLTSPVGLLTGSFTTTRILVEEEYVRASPGGTGIAKCGGNYAGAMRAMFDANKKGYNQVLWLDAIERKYIEEVSTSNIFFVIDGTVVTPAISDTILDGITRRSLLALLKDWGIPIEERRISIQELVDAYKAGKVEEVFSSGTATVVTPIGQITYGDTDMEFNNNEVGPISKRLFEELTDIQKGVKPDPHGWITKI